MTTTIETTTETKILIRAKELIQRGWCQHQGTLVTDELTSYCAGFAIDSAAGRQEADKARRFHARLLLLRVVGGGIEAWNDRPGRTHEEVLAAFDRAIALGMGLTP